MILPFIISGLVTGSIYGLAAVGLVVSYKTSGIFNFAHGAIATVAAYVFYTLHVQHGVNWPVSVVIVVFGVGPVLGLTFERLAKTLTGRSLAVAVTSTVGVLLIIENGALLIYGVEQIRTVPIFLAQGHFTIDGTVIQYSELITFLFAIVATTLLYAFFRFTRKGMAMRAVVEAPALLELSGTSATSVRRYAWVIGVCFASASGVLFSTLLQLEPIVLTLLVVAAYGAAAIGAFRSLPLTFVGGLIVGVLASLATKFSTTGILSGVSPSLPFIVLFAVMLLFPRKYLAERSRLVPETRSTWVTPAPVQLVGAVVVVAALAVVPALVGVHLLEWTIALANIILFLSLGLLVRMSGQVSLTQVAFMAIGAAAFGHFTTDLHIPWFFSLILAMLIVVPIGALLAIPAIRLTPLYLALATLGFGLFVQNMFYTSSFMFGSSGEALNMPRPTWLGLSGDKGFYYLVLVCTIVVAAFVVILNRSRLGRLLRGMADAPRAVETNGATVRVAWILVFCLSAALAAGAGVLSGVAQQTTSLTSYPPLQSLSYLALILIVAGGAPWYAVIAGLAWTLPTAYIPSGNVTYWLQLIFGVFAVLYAFTPERAKGTPLVLQRWFDARFRGGGARVQRRATTLPDTYEAPSAAAGELRLEDISMRFGGLIALQSVSLAAPTGRITGVIGPNGAGKSTMFDICSGLTKATSGRVYLDDTHISRFGPSERARRGLGRTFQIMELCESLTVWENIALGAEGGLAGANPARHILPRRRDGRLIRASAGRAIEMCGLQELVEMRVSSLSTGQRRLVELARCVAGPYRIMLLDEPSSGLDRTETAAFAKILLRLVDERQVGILLVEHDVALVMQVCQHIYVLDFGRIIFEGAPSEVQASRVVQAAYLGEIDSDAELAGTAGAVTGSEAEEAT